MGSTFQFFSQFAPHEISLEQIFLQVVECL